MARMTRSQSITRIAAVRGQLSTLVREVDFVLAALRDDAPADVTRHAGPEPADVVADRWGVSWPDDDQGDIPDRLNARIARMRQLAEAREA